MKWVRRIYDWTLLWAARPSASYALFFVAFIESSFFPIPPDVLLIAMCTASPNRGFGYAAVCALGSVAGGLLGYAIGYYSEPLAHAMIAWLGLNDAFLIVQKKFQDNAFLAIFVAAFTPIPYKAFTLTAGLCKINLLDFVLASIVGRSMRFFLVSTLFYFFGAVVRAWIEKYFDLFVTLLTVALLLLFYLIQYF